MAEREIFWTALAITGLWFSAWMLLQAIIRYLKWERLDRLEKRLKKEREKLDD